MVVFLVFGVAYVVLSLSWAASLPWSAMALPLQATMVIAGLAALVVLVYDGFVMSYSPSIPLWNTALLPVLFGGYGLMGGSTALLFLNQTGLVRVMRGAESLHNTELLLIVINLFILLTYLASTLYATAAARKSVILLTRERYRAPFLGGVIFVGLILTFFFSLYLATSGSLYLLFGLALAELVGDFLLINLLLRAGVFAPLLPRWSY